MTCNLKSFLTVFLSYMDKLGRGWGKREKEGMIMKACVQWNPVYGKKAPSSSGSGTEPAEKVERI